MAAKQKARKVVACNVPQDLAEDFAEHCKSRGTSINKALAVLMIASMGKDVEDYWD